MSKRRAEEFPSFLKSRLPQSNHIRVYHVSTSPSPCSPLFSAAAGRLDEATTLESHLLSVSQSRPNSSHSNGHSLNVLVLGIEVLIFTTSKLTTVFVSKADSTGFVTKLLEQDALHFSLVQTVITTFLEYLLTAHANQGRVVLSLFARSQNQYLFPGSIENPTKHVLDDRQLIKWWCRVLDPIARQAKSVALQSAKAYVVVPGCDKGETKAFFPPSARSDPPSDSLWLNDYPVTLMVEDSSLPPRCLIPRFPDDPKSRFLDDLDGQLDGDDNWRGIKTLEQFWEMMSYRQECSAGRLVGFVWVIFTPSSESVMITKEAGHGEDRTPAEQKHSQQLASALEYARNHSQGPPNNMLQTQCQPVSPTVPDVTRSADPERFNVTAALKNATGNPVNEDTALTDFISQSERKLAKQESEISASQLPVSLCSEPPAQIVLSAENYQVLMDELLQLDFAGEDLAVDSTQRWVEKAKTLAGASQFGIGIEGTLAEIPSTAASGPAMEQPSTAPINLLTGVCKKRKIEHATTVEQAGASSVNILATNLIRKKPKA